jgi:hypothetical protein
MAGLARFPGKARAGEGSCAVINVQVSNGMLRVRLSGWDAFATCWRRSWEYEVPVSKIARVYVRPAKPAIGDLKRGD